MAGDSPSGEGGGALAKRQRINADDRAQLHDFFVSKDWALNTNLPGEDMSLPSGEITTEAAAATGCSACRPWRSAPPSFGNPGLKMAGLVCP